MDLKDEDGLLGGYALGILDEGSECVDSQLQTQSSFAASKDTSDGASHAVLIRIQYDSYCFRSLKISKA